MKTALTIAGSDSSGGAGIQADIKTMTANGVFALCAVTALTAQNTTGVTDILESTPHFLAEQLDAVFTDIFPDAVKIGMVSSIELIRVIAEKLRQYGARHIVVDPVMVATSGANLLRPEAVETLTRELLPLATVLTPNIPEAEILSGLKITDAAGMEAAARTISEKYGCAVLCKGGHQVNDADDLLWRDGAGKWFRGKRIDNPNTHGTGCTLSSAIASNLAKGFDLDTSVERAKAYISGALGAMLDLGRGSGPMNHMFARRNAAPPSDSTHRSAHAGRSIGCESITESTVTRMTCGAIISTTVSSSPRRMHTAKYFPLPSSSVPSTRIVRADFFFCSNLSTSQKFAEWIGNK